VRIVLSEKGLEHETVVVDLDDRPAWIYEKNPLGRVPVLEEDAFVLPESAVIMEYLEERYPEPPLWPADPAERAAGRLLVERFDQLSRPYYALRRGDEEARDRLSGELGKLDAVLAARPFLSGREFGIADAAYLPWILRAETMLGVDLDQYAALAEWVARTGERPSVAAETTFLAAR
jgi:glutathione S-transferase